MRIALLAPLPPEQTGIADYAAQLCQALRDCGMEMLTPLVGVDAQADEREISDHLDKVDWCGIDLAHAELGGGRAREFLALEHLHRNYPHLALTATAHDPERLIWRSPRLPKMLRWADRAPRPLAHAVSLLADPITLMRERALADGLDGLVTLTKTGAVCLRKRMQISPKKVLSIPHGVPVITGQPLPEAPLRLLYFGFIYPGKGIEDLIDAFAEVARHDPSIPISLTLAGGVAPDITFGGANGYLNELKGRVADLDLESHIFWQPDIPATAIADLILDHHAMVLPYREPRKLSLLGQMRGTSGALSWALACGRGVITSDARAFAEEVAHGNGVVFAQGNSYALAAAILQLLDEPSLARQWAQCAANVGTQRHWPLIAARFGEMFKSIVEGRRYAV